MYGFRPARNRQHPGDRPPKWAPLGRFGRVAILLTVVAGVVIALLIIGTRPADSLDEALNAPPEASPEPPPWFGGRVEMPEHGLAVTVPDDWVAFDTAVDYLIQLEVASDFLDPSLYSPDSVKAVQEFPTYASRGIQLDVFHATNLDGCIAGVRPGSVPLDRASDGMYDTYVDESGFGDVEAPQAIDLPAGVAYRIDISAPHSTGVAQSSVYLLGTDESHAMLICTSDLRPDDDWLSIAETFEFLPAEE